MDIFQEMEARQRKGEVLLQNIKQALPELTDLLENIKDGSEDRIYRFYHFSFKTYWLQDYTEKILNALKEISPHEDKEEFDKSFLTIIKEGTSKEWNISHNKRWLKETRPLLEAFFHCKYFLEMAVKYGSALEEAPNLLPSGWAALLELYNIR